MKEYSKFELIVLALTAAALLLMGGVYAAGQFSPVEVWRVEVERTDSPAISESREEDERPDSLLEGEVVDLNKADEADFGRLPGVGEKRARSIVEYRQDHGPFKTVDDLIRVDGIGPGILEQLRPYVTVG